MELYSIIKDKVKEAVNDLYDIRIDDVAVERPVNEKHGDYSSNVALEITKKVEQTPLEIAKNLSYKLVQMNMTHETMGKSYKIFEEIEAASPGFINFKLSKEWLHYVLYDITESANNYGAGEKGYYTGKNVVVEYTDPNPFKVFHIGHLMSNSIGESLTRLIGFKGGNVKRANYQGDVGLHVAKSIWGLIKLFSEEGTNIGILSAKTLTERMGFLGKAYALGATLYEENEGVEEEIKFINYLVYAAAQEHMAETKGWKPLVDYKKFITRENHPVSTEGIGYDSIKELYTLGRAWSLEYFETIYNRLGTHFDYYYYESFAGEFGYSLVKEWLGKGVFEESESAVVFRGEPYGLHTRVFINSKGLPTYEAKDLGLALIKKEDFEYDLSFIVTANEITEYFKVVLKALSKIEPDVAVKTRHIPHGMMKLTSGKMSSRTGKVIAGESLLNDVKKTVLDRMKEQENKRSADKIADKIAIASLKYSILKQNIGKDIEYDKEKSVDLTGDTGPYLQYTYARTVSLLSKSDYEFNPDNFVLEIDNVLQPHPLEEAVLRQIHKFPEDVDMAANNLSPHIICKYLFTLAQTYNTLYAKLPILSAEPHLRKKRLYITKAVNHVLKNGLYLLGIEVVERM